MGDGARSCDNASATAPGPRRRDRLRFSFRPGGFWGSPVPLLPPYRRSVPDPSGIRFTTGEANWAVADTNSEAALRGSYIAPWFIDNGARSNVFGTKRTRTRCLLASLAPHWPCSAGGHSVEHTGPESDVRPARRGGTGRPVAPGRSVPSPSGARMELVRFELTTSWVRSRRSPN